MESSSSFWISSSVQPVYRIEGTKGKSIEVYADKVVIRTHITVGSGMQQTNTDIEKVIYYTDCVSVTLKRSGMLLGFLQFETSASKKDAKNYDQTSENLFVYEIEYELMVKVYNYIISRMDEIKKGAFTYIGNQVSSAEELLKFRKLKDAGIITQGEYDAKKRLILSGNSAITSVNSGKSAGAETKEFSTNRSSIDIFSLHTEEHQSTVSQSVILERWICPVCGDENAHYTHQCSCGFKKKDLPPEEKNELANDTNPWTCPSCGTVNPHYTTKCSCGFEKKDLPAPEVELAPPVVDKSPWVCPECKVRNPHYTTMCSCGFEKKKR